MEWKKDWRGRLAGSVGGVCCSWSSGLYVWAPHWCGGLLKGKIFKKKKKNGGILSLIILSWRWHKEPDPKFSWNVSPEGLHEQRASPVKGSIFRGATGGRVGLRWACLDFWVMGGFPRDAQPLWASLSTRPYFSNEGTDLEETFPGFWASRPTWWKACRNSLECWFGTRSVGQQRCLLLLSLWALNGCTSPTLFYLASREDVILALGFDGFGFLMIFGESEWASIQFWWLLKHMVLHLTWTQCLGKIALFLRIRCSSMSNSWGRWHSFFAQGCRKLGKLRNAHFKQKLSHGDTDWVKCAQVLFVALEIQNSDVTF